MSIFYHELELQPCFAPEYEIIVEFEKFCFLSLEVLVFSISKTSSLQIKTQVCRVWQYRLWSFHMGDTKLERFLLKNQLTQRKLLNFEIWMNGELSKSAKI